MTGTAASNASNLQRHCSPALQHLSASRHWMQAVMLSAHACSQQVSAGTAAGSQWAAVSLQ